ncbi:hypothetical protein HYH02_010183 [Chlamydomonas schloesseri]|uniref:BZIP domain-containing protein n=1 Tax=Chlamydomonas schloesseri TaxID=2026947 RepID=A0A835T869_9CHLO|nr:hypothetical protein HYH02_010183 [Chlamydomonas schloesseri]|eukprot:KAG2440604.1 hypothetical protein HYH02_010183 [Chlamydomonas schloesseri]
MDVDGLDLAALLAEGPESGPALLDDELFSEDLMQFLETIEGQPTATQCHQKLAQQQQQQPALAPAPAVSTAATAPVAASPAVAMSPTPSSSSGCSSGVVAAPVPIPTPVAPAAAAVALAALQQAQMQPACAMLPRLVTTTAAQQMWTAMLQAACTVTPAIAAAQAAPVATAPVDEAKARAQSAGTSRQGSREDSGDSSDTDHDDDMVDSKGKSAGNKRKAPEVDWRQIEDPAERRRQRRLAKNRVTAARSRERKKAAWSELEERLKSIETENAQLRAMLETFARENTALKAQLLTVAAAGGVPGLHQQAGKTMDPATVLPVFIAIMLVVSALLPGDKACALLGSLLPLALIAAMMGAAGSGAGAKGGAAFDCLFHLMHMLNTLLSKSGRTLQRSLKRMMMGRQRYLGAKGMAKLGAAGAQLFDQLLNTPPPSPPSAADPDPGLAPGSPSDSDGRNNAPMDVDAAGAELAKQAPMAAACAAAVSGTKPAAVAQVVAAGGLQAAGGDMAVAVKQEPVC